MRNKKKFASLVMVLIIIFGTSITAMAAPSANTKGRCMGDGVAVRVKADRGSTALGRMYKGEKIYYDINYVDVNNDASFRYVMRTTVSMTGWSDGDFLEPYNW